MVPADVEKKTTSSHEEARGRERTGEEISAFYLHKAHDLGYCGNGATTQETQKTAKMDKLLIGVHPVGLEPTTFSV